MDKKLPKLIEEIISKDIPSKGDETTLESEEG